MAKKGGQASSSKGEKIVPKTLDFLVGQCPILFLTWKIRTNNIQLSKVKNKSQVTLKNNNLNFRAKNNH